MRTVLFSDLHGKLDSLKELLSRSEGDLCVCLGDVLGQGDNDGCLDLLLAREIPCIKGNHEVDLWAYYSPSLDDDLREWVSGWPTQLLDGHALLSHCWLRPFGKGFIFARLRSPDDAASMFDSSDFLQAFIGHSHEPGWWETTKGAPRWTQASAGQRLDWAPNTRYIVDVGSLGEPYRPTDPRWVVWDDTGVTWHTFI